MQCDYFDAGLCRSCTLMNQPTPVRMTILQDELMELLRSHSELRWLPPFISAESGFRNKAKMVVAGTRGQATLGILDRQGLGIDLRHCGLCTPGLQSALDTLGNLINELGFTPYDVPTRRGELKYLLVTESPDGELMIRFVLRSRAELHLVRRALPLIQKTLPAAVVSVNLQAEHKAIVEGPDELVLTEQETLPMHLGGITLHLRTRSFFQTNTQVAAALYEQGAAWVRDLSPERIWDLYCGVGGFALSSAYALQHTAGSSPRDTHPCITGIELSSEAISSARQSAREAGLNNVSFAVADATDFVRTATHYPDLVIVNPPRRGLGAELAAILNDSAVPHILYSSCNAASLAKDLALMDQYLPQQARLMDMFPQTKHYEAMVLLARR